jgi:hypothetical protein
MDNIILCGDSIFDNKAYVSAGSPVIEQLTNVLGGSSNCTLLAVDGDIASDVAGQFKKMPSDASHLFLSVGGNDALQCSFILEDETLSAHELLSQLAIAQEHFKKEYRKIISMLLSLKKPLCVCTIYDAVPGLDAQSVMALSIFNDVITREALCHGLSVIDLRVICNNAIDFSEISPIEPSCIGGQRIAEAIAAEYKDYAHNKR